MIIIIFLAILWFIKAYFFLPIVLSLSILSILARAVFERTNMSKGLFKRTRLCRVYNAIAYFFLPIVLSLSILSILVCLLLDKVECV